MTPAHDRPGAVLRELLTALGREDLTAMTRRWTPTTSGTVHPLATTLRDRDEVVAFFEEAFAALDDIQLDIESVHESGDTAVAQWRMRATFLGAEVAGLRATGGHIDVRGVDVQRIVDGAVVHADVYFDALTVLRQLGIAPDSGTAIEGAVRTLVNARTLLGRLVPGGGQDSGEDGDD